MKSSLSSNLKVYISEENSLIQILIPLDISLSDFYTSALVYYNY